MGRTEIGSSQIRNSDVKREDIHVSSNVNESLIRKVLAGINMSLTAESGIASGTGDVTINVVPNPSFSGVITSTVATGTAPFSIVSTTMVSNLNADLLDGYHASAFQPLLTNPVTGTGTQNYVAKWNNAGGTTIGNSVIYDDGTNVGIGTTTFDSVIDGLEIRPHSRGKFAHLVTDTDGSRRIGLYIDNSGGNSSIYLYNGSTTLKTLISSSSDSYFNGGNVGIGTTLPAYKLDVVGNLLLGADYPAGGARTTLTNKSSFICYPHYDNTEEKVIGFYGYSGSGSSSVVFGGGSSGHNAVTLLAFYTAATSTTLGGSERMRVSSDGKVSIGTSNSVSLLTVNGDVFIGSDATFWAGDDFKLRIKGTNQGFAVNTNLPVSTSTGLAFSIGVYGEGYARTNFYSSGNVGWGSGIATRDTFLGRVAASTLGVFGAYDGTGSSDFVVSGKVGIGQTNPSLGRLEINRASGEYGSTYPFVVKRYNGSEAVREYMDGVWNYYIDSSNAAGTNSNIYLYGKGTGYVLIPSGRLGIGITGPTEKLHVNGNIRVTGAYYDSSNNPGTSGQILKSTATGTDWVSLNEIAGVDGTGTANYFTKWIDADTIGNSQIYENSTNKYIDFNWRSISRAIVWPNLYDSRQNNYNAFLNAGDVWVNAIDRGATLTQYTGYGAISAVEVYRTGYTTSTVINGGSGYSVNDVLTVTGGNGAAQVRVDTIDGSGKALTLTVVNGGANYYTGSNISTTGGTGTGCKLYIKSVSGNARAGTSVNGGSINTLFRSPTQACLHWSSVSSTNPVELTLDWSTLGQMHIYRFMMVPASRNQMPISYKVEVYTNDSYYGYDRWHEHYNVTGETSTYLKMVNLSNGPTERLLAIRITVYEAGDLDQTGYLSLQNIIGYERYIGGGRFTGYNLGVSGDVAYGGYTFYPALNSPIPITLKGSDSTVLFRIQESTSAANYLDVSNVSMLAYRGTGSNSGFTFTTQNAGSWGAGADAGCFIFKPNNVEGLRILKHGTLTQSITDASECEALRTNLKNVQTTGLGAMWSVYANTDTSADFFGKTGFKFVGGTADAYKQWRVYISNSSTPKLVLTNAGYFGIGMVTPAGTLHVAKAAADNLIYADNYSTTSGNTNYWFSRRSNSDTLGTLSTTVSGSYLGAFYFQGVNTSNAFAYGAGIVVQQYGDAGTYIPTNLILNTYSATAINSNQLVLASSGHIGVGMSDPDGRIHLYSQGAANMVKMTAYYSGGNQTWAHYIDSGGFYIKDGSYRFHIHTSTGNVGINSTSPVSKLTVYDDAAQSLADGYTTLRIENLTASGVPGTTGGQITFAQRYYSSATALIRTGAIRGIKTASDGDYGGGLQLLYQPLGATSMVVGINLDHKGFVGLSYATPQARLHLGGDPTDTNQPWGITNSVNDLHTGLFINGSGNATGEKYGIQFGNYMQYGFAGIYSIMTSTSGTTVGDLTFDLRATTTDQRLTERMRITNDGRIGIGIASSIPATLSIKSYGSTNATKAFFIKNSSDTELFTIYDDGSMSIPGSIIGLRGYSEQIEIQDDGTYSIALTYAPKGIQYIHLCKNGMTLRRTIDYVVYNSSYLNLTGTADYFNTDDDVYVEYYY